MTGMEKNPENTPDTLDTQPNRPRQTTGACRQRVQTSSAALPPTRPALHHTRQTITTPTDRKAVLRVWDVTPAVKLLNSSSPALSTAHRPSNRRRASTSDCSMRTVRSKARRTAMPTGISGLFKALEEEHSRPGERVHATRRLRRAWLPRFPTATATRATMQATASPFLDGLIFD